MKILLLTPLNLEYLAIRKHLINSSIKTVTKGSTKYEQGQFLGKFHTFQIILKQTGSKNTDIALIIEKAIQHFNPGIIILTGIAGGVKDVKIGDVVIANKLYSYESGKETAQGFVARPDAYNCSLDLIELAQEISLENTWQNRSIHAKDSLVHFGPIASGNKVIASTNSIIFERLKTYYNDTIALEMEAAGFGKAILHHPQIKFINIRGISDLLDNKTITDTDGGQEVAVDNAAAFLFEFLNKLNLRQLNPLQGEGAPSKDVMLLSEERKKLPTINEKKKINSKLLGTSLLKMTFFSLTLIGFSFSFKKCNFIGIENFITGNINQSEDTSNSEEEKPLEKELTQKGITQNLEKKISTKLTISNTPEPYKNILRSSILSQASKYNFSLNQIPETEQFNRILNCSISVDETEIDIGIRPTLKVYFTLTTTYSNLSNNKIIGENSISSEVFWLYDKKEIALSLKKWLREIDTNIFPVENFK